MAASDIINVTHKPILIGGVVAHVYSWSDIAQSNLPVQVFFMLHMRMGSYLQVEPKAQLLIKEITKNKNRTADILVVSFDHRNHGARLVEERANKTWDEGNDLHGIDMYSMVVGGARDISFLIDFIPPYVFPNGEKRVEKFGVVGISMGGHAAWVALSQDPRLTTGCVIVGCPAYLELVVSRATGSGRPLTAPYIPDGFLKVVERTYAGSVPYKSSDTQVGGLQAGQPINPFVGKRVFVQAGGKDQLIPWRLSEGFVNDLVVGQNGEKKSKIYPDAAHECPDEMIMDAANFIMPGSGSGSGAPGTVGQEAKGPGPAYVPPERK